MAQSVISIQKKYKIQITGVMKTKFNQKPTCHNHKLGLKNK